MLMKHDKQTITEDGRLMLDKDQREPLPKATLMMKTGRQSPTQPKLDSAKL